VFCLTKTSF